MSIPISQYPYYKAPNAATKPVAITKKYLGMWLADPALWPPPPPAVGNPEAAVLDLTTRLVINVSDRVAGSFSTPPAGGTVV